MEVTINDQVSKTYCGNNSLIKTCITSTTKHNTDYERAVILQNYFINMLFNKTNNLELCNELTKLISWRTFEMAYYNMDLAVQDIILKLKLVTNINIDITFIEETLAIANTI